MPRRAANDQRLKAFIEAEAEALLGTLRFYVLRAGLAAGDAIPQAAQELLNEVVVEALDHAGRFRPDGEPKAWLLGIAANLVKRRQADLAKRQRREPLAADLAVADEAAISEDDLFDQLADLADRAQDGPEAQVEAQAQVDWLLAHVSAEDAHLLRLAVLHDLDGAMLARALDVSPGAARVRLHRALNRLRAALAAEPVGEGRKSRD